MIERFVDADGFHVRYIEHGEGPPLIHIHGGGGLRVGRAHELLGEHFTVLALEVPGFGYSAPNERSRSYPDLAASLVKVGSELTGGTPFNLWGTSFGGAVALWMAVHAPEAIQALVLESPGAVLPEGGIPASSSPEEMRRRLFVHPERQPDPPPPDPRVLAQQRVLLDRLQQPTRPEVETAMAGVQTPTLVVFGTGDRVISPEMGRVYREKMPNCNYVLLFDAGHAAGAERPEAFTSLVGDFLTRREAFVVTQRSSMLNP
jgi:pimeloyl-ACP methyl ester carboxylesterase